MFDALATNPNVADFTAKNIRFQATETGLIAYVSGSWNSSDVNVPVPLHDWPYFQPIYRHHAGASATGYPLV